MTRPQPHPARSPRAGASSACCFADGANSGRVELAPRPASYTPPCPSRTAQTVGAAPPGLEPASSPGAPLPGWLLRWPTDPSRKEGRDHDERILLALFLRGRGRTTREIAAVMGTTEMTVRVATNKVRAADLMESGESERGVLAGYWPVNAASAALMGHVSLGGRRRP